MEREFESPGYNKAEAKQRERVEREKEACRYHQRPKADDAGGIEELATRMALGEMDEELRGLMYEHRSRAKAAVEDFDHKYISSEEWHATHVKHASDYRCQHKPRESVEERAKRLAPRPLRTKGLPG